MEDVRTAIRVGLRACIASGVALGLAGCTIAEFDWEDLTIFEFTQTPVDNLGPEEKFPLAVEKARAALDLPGAKGEERLTAGEIRKIDDFVAAFMAERRGQLLISVPGAAAGDARVLGRAKQVAEHARRRGLPADRIMLRVADDDQRADGPVVVSYEKLVMRVPECGDWSKESSHDLTNTTHSDFGCAMQRNIGLMIADPGDLIAPRTAGLHDTLRSNLIIQQYRAGQPTGARRAVEERAALIAQ